MKPSRAAAPLLALMLIASGCGGSEKVKEADGDTKAPIAGQASSSASSSASAGSLDMDKVVEYFEGINTGNVDDYAKSVDLAAPGSLAYAYAFHQQQLAQALLDEGTEESASNVADDDGVVTVCDAEKTCYKYKDFEAKDGRLASFTINGLKLADRLSIGNGAVVSAGRHGSVKFLSAYKSASGALFVVVEVKTKKEAAQFQAYTALYRSPSGRQAKASSGSSTEVLADSTSNLVMTFPGAQPGGVVTMDVVDTDFSNPVLVKIKTR